ncbi:hypothetical protein KUM42_17625 [Modestobacter sp. L9-4]|uniref:hypothetical protein n=1 Tax=Modestobacter sp. L9-4 TaxID=2851567 RepID=UPI001C782D16|nr:hypothetical protein [Modestobacter sp. L9-4]QXG75602.1 hypothetical protein KUM42_17625 [Modestobacter sp. L9-4]
MTDAINELAAEAAAAYPGGTVYAYAAQDAVTARILVVEEGGPAFPEGRNIGAPDDDVTGKWAGILEGAGFEPGMWSWWNAIPCGLDRPLTADDKARGAKYLKRAIALHPHLEVVLAVGLVAQQVVGTARPSARVLKTRSPLRTGAGQREEIRGMFERARLDAYPFGFHRED